MRYSVVIPAYNEEKRIRSTLKKLLEGFERNEILVVDDGSTDETAEIARGLGVRVIRHGENIGKGGAIITGFFKGEGDVIGFIDADESMDIGDIRRVFEEAQHRGVAIASRRHPSSKILVRQPLTRVLSSRIFNLFVRIFFGLNTGDTQCGCKAFQRRVAKHLAKKARCNGFEIDVELLWLTRVKGLKIVEVPITWRHERGSSFSLREGPKMVLSLIGLRLGLKQRKVLFA